MVSVVDGRLSASLELIDKRGSLRFWHQLLGHGFNFFF